MAVNAKFQADFTDFISAINQADIKLVDFGKGANKVEGTLNRMVDSFSGRKLIQEASLMTVAIEKAGGISVLTARELEQVGNRANEAADKLRRLGYEVPAGLDKLAESTKGVTTTTDRFRGSLTQFDSVLSQVGINISGEIRAVEEIGTAAGKTASEIGALGTAGLALGAGFAGWKIGRMVADFFDLDKTIANTTARVLGYGDVAAEVAGAQQDTINKAIKDGAAANITYADAVAYNTAKQKEHLAALAKAGEVHKQHEAELKRIQAEEERWGAIMAELTSVGGTLTKTIDGMSGEVVEAIKFYLDAGVSQNTLAQAYGVTASQIRAITEAMREQKAFAEFEEAARKRRIEVLAIETRATNDLVVAKLRETQAQEALNAAFLANELAAAQAADRAMFGSGGGISPEIHGNQRGPAINSTGATVGRAGAAGFQLGNFTLRAGGGSVSAGQGYVVGERGPELFTPGSNGFITPNGGGSTNVVIYVNGTAEEVARKVAAEFTRTMKSSTKVKVTQ